MLQQIEGSAAVAQALAACRPEVIAAYQKKAEFGGGALSVEGLELSGVESRYLAEEASSLFVDGERRADLLHVPLFPGALETMETTVCADYRGTRLIEGAGHWVQQEQPEPVIAETRLTEKNIDSRGGRLDSTIHECVGRAYGESGPAKRW